MKKFLVLLVLFFVSTNLTAQQAFTAGRKMSENVAAIQATGLNLGYKVNKVAAEIAAAVIKGKQEIYPNANILVTMKEIDGKLFLMAQATAENAGTAKWHHVPAKKV